MGRLVKLVGSGIGLATEAVAARKASKNADKAPNAPGHNRDGNYEHFDDLPPQYAEVDSQQADHLIARGQAVPVDAATEKQLLGESSSFGGADEGNSRQFDDELWELDEAVGAQTPPAEDEQAADQQRTQKRVDKFIARHPPPRNSSPLPLPVIIPQRRPQNKQRGFVRAYAPVLQDCGIDQPTFLEFLQVFHQSSKEDPWLNVVNVAGAIAGLAPSVIAMGVSIGVQVTAGVAMEIQRRARANSFLDRVNDQFFKPRGLYCFVMAYKPDSTAAYERVDMTNISKNMPGFMKNLRVSSGTTYGELELPEAAPLVFPALDRVATDASAEGVKKQNKMKSSQKFVADYFDRRAQAQYAGENPGSALAVPGAEKQQFASRYSDPNHPANSGSLISLVTGGKVDVRGARSGLRARLGGGESSSSGLGNRLSQRREKGGLKRLLKADVLYLMIVNLPSEEEMQAALNAVGRGDQRQY